METRTQHHHPVLLEETITTLAIQPQGIYVDGTFGRGGHSDAILGKLAACGQLFLMDKDPDAIRYAEERFGGDKRCHIWQGSFVDMRQWAQQWEIDGKVNGILLDLGVSSPQLDTPERGFSFLHDGPLDMRMNPNKGHDAASWLSTVNETALADVLKRYGEERYAARIARMIVKTRIEAPLQTTHQLAQLIEKAAPSREKNKHPATRSFLAIRLFINQELEELQKGLEACEETLAPLGRLAVISFHSLEDRIVKNFIRAQSKHRDSAPPDMPIRNNSPWHPKMRPIAKIKPSLAERRSNKRARSALLRVAEKL